MRVNGFIPKLIKITPDTSGHYDIPEHCLVEYPPHNGVNCRVFAIKKPMQAQHVNTEEMLLQNNPMEGLRVVGRNFYEKNEYLVLDQNNRVYSVSEDSVVDAAVNGSINSGVMSGSYVWFKPSHNRITLIRVGSRAHQLASAAMAIREMKSIRAQDLCVGDVLASDKNRRCIYLGSYKTISHDFINENDEPTQIRKREKRVGLFFNVPKSVADESIESIFSDFLQKDSISNWEIRGSLSLSASNLKKKIGHINLGCDFIATLKPKMTRWFTESLRQMQTFSAGSYRTRLWRREVSSWAPYLNLTVPDGKAETCESIAVASSMIG